MRDYGRVHIVELVVVRPRALGKPRIDYNFCVDFPHATWMQAVVQCCSYHSQKNSVLRKMVQFQLSSAVSIALRTMIPLKSFELPHGRIPASGYVVRTYLIDVQKSVRVMRQDDVIMTPCRMISDWDDLIMFSV